MPLYSNAAPTIIYKQASQPAVETGIFWLDTDTQELFYCDGTSFIELTTTAATTFLQEIALENSLAILEIQAADAITAGTSAEMVRDIFSDSNGYLNTLNTGSTTANFSVNKYINETTTDTADAHGETLSPTASQTAKNGFKIETNFACSAVSITKHATCDATTAYILDSGLAVLATATFSGNTATFSTPYSLADATTYYVALDKGGAAYTNIYTNPNPTFPVADTNFDWITGLWNGADNASGSCITSVTTRRVTGYASKIVQTATQTLNSSPAFFQIFAYKKATSGAATITADISFNGGTNYQTGVALDTAIAVVNTGTSMILKINLNTTEAAECQGYGVLYW